MEKVFTNLTTGGPISVYVEDGKITRIRPLQVPEEDYPKAWTVEDKNGKKFTLINSAFTVSKNSIIPGDLNDDKSVTISDAVLLQSYLIKGYSFTALQYASADMNGDNCVDTFDLVFLKKKINEK